MDNCSTQQWDSGDYKEHVTRVYPSEVTACKSGPDTRLTELEQQLEVAETRCGSLKSQLDYMKMLYQGIQVAPADLAKTVDLPQTQPNPIPLTPTPKLPPPVELDNFEENPATEDVKYYQFLKEIHKMQQMTREDAEPVKKSPRQSSRSPRTSPRISDRHYVAPEENENNICAEYRHSKQNKTRSKTYTLLDASPSSVPAPATTHLPIPLSPPKPQIQEVCREHDIDDATALQHPYQQHLMEYSRCLQEDLATAKELTIQSVTEEPCDYDKQPLSASRKGTKKQELILKLSGSMDSARATKRKKSSKPDKKTKISLYSGSGNKKTVNVRTDDTISVTSKIRRKRGKLRSANSKSTVATKDANLTDRKDHRKRKQKGFSSSSYTQVPRQTHVPLQRQLNHWGEVVEIYHNNAAGGGSGSISLTSSKHSRPEPRRKDSENGSTPFKKEEHRLISSPNPTYQQQVPHEQQISQQNQGASYLSPHTQTVTRTLKQNTAYDEAYSSTCPAGQNYAIESYNEQQPQCRHTASLNAGYYDPTVVRNYELPTVASKLKQVNRSYFNRFNFRNIPFVVGTSVTPSHNLGLNIQQVLSIMKTRQPMSSGITPLLIRKVSKGMRPMSSLLDRINDQPQKSPKISAQTIGQEYASPPVAVNNLDKNMTIMDEATAAQYAGYLPMQAPRLTNIPNSQTYYGTQQAYANTNNKNPQDPLYEEEEETPSETQWHERQQSGCTCCPKKNGSYNKMLKQFTSKKSIIGNSKLTASALLKQRQEELNIGDGQYTQPNLSGRAKGIREVLINLHDQFEELNGTYEKLQEQAEKSDDKSVNKQIAALEKELNAKEEEINAVVGLYKEVLSLKQEVQNLHTRSSFVCVATNEGPVSPSVMQSPKPVRVQAANPLQIFGMRKGPPATSREPSTTTRLAGLLRQIQSFQKQLKLAS